MDQMVRKTGLTNNYFLFIFTVELLLAPTKENIKKVLEKSLLLEFLIFLVSSQWRKLRGGRRGVIYCCTVL